MATRIEDSSCIKHSLKGAFSEVRKEVTKGFLPCCVKDIFLLLRLDLDVFGGGVAAVNGRHFQKLVQDLLAGLGVLIIGGGKILGTEDSTHYVGHRALFFIGNFF